jgi:ABC-type antimicrobial peptide transport system permease subunit
MTSCLVSCRTFDIEVRVASGATRLNVISMILRPSIVVALLGVVLGLLGCLAATRVLSTFSFDISTTDPITLVAVALLHWAAAMVTSHIPARRAASVDRVLALRGE